MSNEQLEREESSGFLRIVLVASIVAAGYFGWPKAVVMWKELPHNVEKEAEATKMLEQKICRIYSEGVYFEYTCTIVGDYAYINQGLKHDQQSK